MQSAWQPPGWTGLPSCAWPGVRCDDPDLHVLFLDLTGLGLKGTIPEDIDGLSFASGLFLGQNLFEGTIPSSLGNLVQMNDDLVLGSNLLTGTIPLSLGRLSLIVKLDLSFNQLTGSISPELGKIRRLQQLWLSGNMLNGTIPDELGQLKTLGELFLDNNRLEGSLPLALSGATNLAYIQLAENRLSGQLPDIFAGMPLSSLNVSNNSFSGRLPSSLASHLSILTLSLDLSYNHFEGPLPPTISGLVNLVTLLAPHNNLSGQVPDWICQMKSEAPYYQTYDLRFNNFSNPLPACCAAPPTGSGLCVN